MKHWLFLIFYNIDKFMTQMLPCDFQFIESILWAHVNRNGNTSFEH